MSTIYNLLPGYMIGPLGYFKGLQYQGMDPVSVVGPLSGPGPQPSIALPAPASGATEVANSGPAVPASAAGPASEQ